jgi:hypothetical protein
MGHAKRKKKEALWDLIISATAQAPTSQSPDVQIGNTDTIGFTNDAQFPVSIHFTTSGGVVFNNIPNLASNATSPAQSPQQSNITVNYTIKNLNNNQVSTPYGIEVGTGPLRINISSAQPTPKVISIPTGGQIQFNSDARYNIVWNPPNCFNPNANQVAQGLNPAQTEIGSSLNSATYELTSVTGSQGGGTVRIGS